MVCHKCGAEMPEDALFCQICGTKLKSHKLCPNCGMVVEDDNLYCTFCGTKIDEISEPLSGYSKGILKDSNHGEERDELTRNQRYFDSDFGYSPENPLVVSSVSTMGYYLMAFRTRNGQAFTWKHEPYEDDKSLDKYSLYLNGQFDRTIFFNAHGNDSSYLPEGLILDAGAFDAAKRGLTPDEYTKELEAKRNAEKKAKAAEELRLLREAEAVRLAEEKKRAEALEASRLAEEKRIADEYAAELQRKEAAEKALQREAQNKKNKRLVVRYTFIVTIVAVLCFAMFFISKEVNYNAAQKLFNTEEYLLAAEKYTNLNGYKESSSKTKESYYLYSKNLMVDGKYREAEDYLKLANGFKDSNELAMECRYNYSVENHALGKYKDAYNVFKSLNGYLDSETYLVDCLYNIVLDNYNNEEYENAYERYREFKRYNDLDVYKNKGYDISFANNLSIKYAEYLIDLGDDININKGLSLLKELKQTSEVKSLISKAETQRKQNKYDLGTKYLNNKQYENAANVFASIKDYLDSKSQWKEAMYLYACNHNNDTDTITYEYLKELKSLGYKNAADMYKTLYSLSVTLTAANTSPDDYTTIDPTVKRDCTYYHMQFKLSGGAPGEVYTLTHTTIYPDGSTYKSDWNWDDVSKNSNFGLEYGNGLYGDPDYGAVGFFTIKIYNKKTGTLVDTISTKIVK